MKDLLLIIDMQNVYLPGQPWSCPKMPEAARTIAWLLGHPLCGQAYDAVFTRFLAPEAPFGCWETYNRAYASINETPHLNQIIPQLEPFLARWPLYDKSVYSSLAIPELWDSLPAYRQILLSGVCAECCVLSTALELVDAGAFIVYLTDAVAGQNHHFDHLIRTVMESFSPIHVKLQSGEEYLEACCRR